MDHNPFLKSEPRPDVPLKGEIEPPGGARNLVWQSRAAPPTDYENALGDALEQVFAGGAESLEDVVAGLNALGIRTPDGLEWDAASFQREMKRFGA